GLLDSVVQAVTIVVIDGRTYPLFAFLFGYGIVQLHRRQLEAGTDERAARRLLQRRNLWLIAFGLVHAALLWMGDVLGAYGLAGLMFVGLFLLRRDRTLLVWAGILTGLLAFFAASSIVGGWAMSGLDLEDVVVGPSLTATQGEPNYLAAMAQRVGFWILLVFGQGLLSLVVPLMILLAFWAARRGILERPLEHARLLRGVAIAGIAIGWLGGVPGMLVHVGAIDIPDHASWLFAGLSSLTGAAAGLGYAALFGLLGGAIARRQAARQDPPRLGFTGAVVAVGRRSLSCYLLQSVL